MTDKQTYRRGWERDFDIEATYYKAEHGSNDFLTINVELQNGYFSQRIECELERLFTLSDQIADHPPAFVPGAAAGAGSLDPDRGKLSFSCSQWQKIIQNRACRIRAFSL